MSEIKLEDLKRFRWSTPVKSLWIVLIIIGAYAFYSELHADSKRAWANYILNYYFWFSISMGGVFFAALQFLTSSHWSVTVRRVAENFIAFLPLAIILFVGLVFGLHDVYEWTHHDVVAADPVLLGKASYLNEKFFVIRHAALFAVMILLGYVMVRNSVKQDENGKISYTKTNAKLAAPFMFLFGWLFTFAMAFDLLKSIDPHFFSTMFGVYCWAGLFTSTLGLMVIFVVQLKKNGYLGNFVSEDHLHDLGKLMFAFMVFWGYVAFSQYMLIWYANLPEEVPYMIKRTVGPWLPVTIILMFVKFILPFFILLSRKAKRCENLLLFMGFWYLLAQWVDIYWMMFPMLYEKPIFGFTEVGMFLGFAGLFMLSLGYLMGRRSLVAVKDPRLELSLHHHQ